MQCHYFNTLYSGAAFGDSGNGPSSTFSFVNGFRYHRLSAGLGIGYDTYSSTYALEAMPLFGMIGYDLGQNGENAFSLNLNLGYSKFWINDIPEWFTNEKVSGGVLIYPLLCYRIHVNQYNLQFGLGYKWQKNKYSYEDSIVWGSPSKYEVDETLQRLVLQIGIGLH